MSLPQTFMDELRSRISLADLVGKRVSWDARKSNRGRGDWWAPCPFHQEKTASFHVDDRKGFYYCFGCHAKGDAIAFIRETENLGFMEAVQALAAEAGMEMPAEDPAAQARAARRTDLTEIMEMAVRQYRRHLSTAQGIEAKEYLQRRGLGPEIQERFGIGFAPDARRFLWDHLTGQGIDGARLIAAGLAAEPDGGGAPYDRFRGRIMFPIRDPRGRCIAFGGRAMDPNARAKYLNSPETDLFDKGRTLYNHGPAREAVGQGAALVVCEGYMDAIALVEAGFGGAVAPLGTAITEHQLQMLWRIAPEPVLALDGDRAGLRAAMRLVDLALPLMQAGQGLRFAVLPPDTDPDDLIRRQGAAAMQAQIDAAQPMIDLLWRRETEGHRFDSPERRAALDRRLQALTAAIGDDTLRRHYRDELRQRQWQLARPPRGRRGAPVPTASPAALSSALASGDPRLAEDLREAVILAVLLRTPAIIAEVEDALLALEMVGPGHAAIRDALIAWQAGHSGDIEGFVAKRAGADRLDMLFARPHLAVVPAVRVPGDTETALACVTLELRKLAARRGVEEELREAAEDPAGLDDQRLVWRLGQAAEARQRAESHLMEDRRAYETGDNGARLDRSERDTFARLVDGIDFTKTGRVRG